MQDISLEQAVNVLLAHTEKVTEVESVGIMDALGRTLAEDCTATFNNPPFDRSPLDGYTFAAAGTVGASADKPAVFRIIGEECAGDYYGQAVPAGCAIRIMTGGAIPAGCDCVVRQESVTVQGDVLQVPFVMKAHENYCFAGEDVKKGTVLARKGTRLTAAHLGVLASVGRSIVAVHQQPTVAILSGGDELVEPDRVGDDGRIVSSNSYTLAAQCREVGARPVYLGIAEDRPESIEARLRAGLRADVIVSSAGVSVGDHDHVRGVLEKLGCRLLFWGVLMKPGYPLAFGVVETTGALVFGLPGNPVSTAVTFEQFVRPVLRKLMGHRQLFRPVVKARLTEGLKKGRGRMHFVRVGLVREGETIRATPTANQSSGVLTSLVRGQGLAIFPAEAERFEPGSQIDVQDIDPGFFDRTERGF